MNKSDIDKILQFDSYLLPDEAEFMYSFLKDLPKKGRLLELGTGLAHSTVFFSKALPKWTIYTVDAHGAAGKEPLIWHLTKGQVNGKGVQAVYDYLKSHKVNNVVTIISSFKDLPWELEVDVLYIDGTHYYKDVKEDFDKFSPFLKKDGIIIFDDYNENWGVKRLVDELKGWKIEHTNTTAILKRI